MPPKEQPAAEELERQIASMEEKFNDALHELEKSRRQKEQETDNMDAFVTASVK